MLPDIVTFADKFKLIPSKLPTAATVGGWGASIGTQFGSGLKGRDMQPDITTFGTSVATKLVARLGPTNATYTTTLPNLGSNLGNQLVTGLARGVDPAVDTNARVFSLLDGAIARLSSYVGAALEEDFGTNTTVSSERRIVVRFEGEAGGSVPLTPDQFYALKNELSFAIRMGG